MKRRALLAVIIIGAIIIACVVVNYLFGLVFPFVLALLLALFIEPIVRFIEQRCRVPRAAAVMSTLIIVLGGFGALFAFGLSQLVRELVALSRDFPVYYNDALVHGGQLLEWLARLKAGLPESVRAAIDSQEAQFDVILAGWLTQLVEIVLGVFSRLPSLFIIIGVSCIAAFFISRDRQLIARTWWRIIPDNWRPQVSTAKNEIITSTFGFIGAQLTVVSVTAVLTAVGFIIIGGRYAITLGIAAGILDLVPYLGPAVVIGPWAVFSLLSGNIALTIKLLLILGVVSVVRQCLEVRLIGERMGIHPLVILFSLYVGMRLFGPIGLLVGPLVALIIKAAAVSGLLQPIIGSEREGSQGEKTYRSSWLNGLNRKTDT